MVRIATITSLTEALQLLVGCIMATPVCHAPVNIAYSKTLQIHTEYSISVCERNFIP